MVDSITTPALWTNSLEGYLLMGFAMFIGGPPVTSASAFAAAFGVFNIWLVFLVSIVSNLIPDAVWYAIGFWGRKQLLERWIKKYGKYVGITHEKIEALERFFGNMSE